MTRGRGRGTPRPAAAWGFTVLERLVTTLRSELGLADEAFDLWGHSAGAQFAHRFALFRLWDGAAIPSDEGFLMRCSPSSHAARTASSA